MTRTTARYGWRPDQPDPRDHIYNLTAAISQGYQLPAIGGLTPSELPPIWDQLQLGSCTAHGSLRIYLARAIKQGLSLPMLSRLMQYFDARSLEGTTSSDAGATVRDAVAALAKFGCCPESEWPYNIAKFAQKPPASCYTDAQQHMAIRYQRILVGSPGAPIRTALANGQAIVFGFPVPEYFEDGSWDPASGQPLPIPGQSANYIGGHCVAATYYDFSGRFVSGPYVSQKVAPFLTCDNSWSADWGMGGRFNIDAQWFNPVRSLASDLWIITQAE